MKIKFFFFMSRRSLDPDPKGSYNIGSRGLGSGSVFCKCAGSVYKMYGSTIPARCRMGRSSTRATTAASPSSSRSAWARSSRAGRRASSACAWVSNDDFFQLHHVNEIFVVRQCRFKRLAYKNALKYQLRLDMYGRQVPVPFQYL